MKIAPAGETETRSVEGVAAACWPGSIEYFGRKFGIQLSVSVVVVVVVVFVVAVFFQIFQLELSTETKRYQRLFLSDSWLYYPLSSCRGYSRPLWKPL